MKNVSQFLHEVRVELSRVEWPSRAEFIGAAIVVLLVVVAFAIFLGVTDKAISAIIKQVFEYSS